MTTELHETSPDKPWTTGDVEAAVEVWRERLETERRERFLAFGIPLDCYWPASRVYHQQSCMGPETRFRLTAEEAAAFTRRLTYKRYPGAVRIPLPHPAPLKADLEDTIRRRCSGRTFSRMPVPIDTLAKLLELGNGVTNAQEVVPRRSAPSAGALYPIEVYPLVFSVEGLSPGIYHYAATDHLLELVRPLSDREGTKPFLPPDLFGEAPPLLLVLSAVFPQVQTKYLERGYRFALLEAGHIAQNLLLAGTALGMNAVPVGGYIDEPFNRMMGFESVTEAVVYCVLIGQPG